MKITRLIDPRLHTVLDRLAKEPLPLRTAFKLKGIIKIAKEESIKYEECRQEALNKHGLRNEDGSLVLNELNHVMFDPENLKIFAAELNDLHNVEVNVPTLTLAELGDVLSATYTVEDIDALGDLIAE